MNRFLGYIAYAITGIFATTWVGSIFYRIYESFGYKGLLYVPLGIVASVVFVISVSYTLYRLLDRFERFERFGGDNDDNNLA